MSAVLTRLLSAVRRRGPLMDYEEAKRLAVDEDAAVRRSLARRGDVQPEILYFLAEDPETAIRRAVATNSATPLQADLLLAGDDDADVRCRVARKIAQIAPQLDDAQRARVGGLVVEVLETLARDRLPEVRRILAEELKDAANVAEGVIHRLATDRAISVAGPVLANSPLLSDEILLEIIASDPIAGALSAISERRDLNAGLSEAIAASDDEAAVAALLANPSAQIREETLDRLVDDAASRPRWHRPLVERPLLSARAIRGLAAFVADGLVQTLLKRRDIDADTAQSVRRIVRQRLEAPAGDAGAADADTDAEADAGAEAARARRLHAKGRLDQAALEKALATGDRRFVVAALALLAGMDAPVVRRIAAQSSAKGMVALAWKAGLGARFAVQLQLRLARIAPDATLKPRPGDAFPLSPDEMDWHLEFFQV
jgi:uncharacterized protein (DUF2336 family)